jgi:hypothetical protein
LNSSKTDYNGTQQQTTKAPLKQQEFKELNHRSSKNKNKKNLVSACTATVTITL